MKLIPSRSVILCTLVGALACAGQTPPVYNIYTFAGSIPLGDGGPATQAMLAYPRSIAFDPQGNLYIADEYNAVIRKVSVDGMISTIAGTGIFGSAGAGGPLAKLQVGPSLYGLAADGDGNLYISDYYYGRLLKATPDGMVKVVLAATSSSPFGPESLALDGAGNLYIADANHQVLKLTPDGSVSRIAGNGTAGDSGDGGPATQAQLSAFGVYVDASGTLYISDTSVHKVRRVTPDGVISTIAGTGRSGFSGDGGPALEARLYSPLRVTGDHDGNLYIDDYGNSRIRMITPDGIISTVAGMDNPNAVTSGDECAATQAMIESPYDIAMSPAGDLYIASRHEFIRMMTADGMLHTAAGRRHFVGDGGPATEAVFDLPHSVAMDDAGNAYISDAGNYRIRKVDAQGIITTLAGTGDIGTSGDGGPAIAASLGRPHGVAVDKAGNVYVGCTDGLVRRISSDGTMSTVAGGGTSLEDGIPATAAYLGDPDSMAVDNAGNLYFGDVSNRIRKVTPDGIITTIAGNGRTGNTGDGGLANEAQLNSPISPAFDRSGNLYFSDMGNHRVRVIHPDGTIAAFAGSGTSGNTGDEGLATAARINTPAGLYVDGAGNVFIADNSTDVGRVRMVTPDGIIHTIAGFTMRGFAGDGGPALKAQFYTLLYISGDSSGRIYLADVYNDRVRVLVPVQ